MLRIAQSTGKLLKSADGRLQVCDCCSDPNVNYAQLEGCCPGQGVIYMNAVVRTLCTPGPSGLVLVDNRNRCWRDTGETLTYAQVLAAGGLIVEVPPDVFCVTECQDPLYCRDCCACCNTVTVPACVPGTIDSNGGFSDFLGTCCPMPNRYTVIWTYRGIARLWTNRGVSAGTCCDGKLWLALEEIYTESGSVTVTKCDIETCAQLPFPTLEGQISANQFVWQRFYEPVLCGNGSGSDTTTTTNTPLTIPLDPNRWRSLLPNLSLGFGAPDNFCNGEFSRGPEECGPPFFSRLVLERWRREYVPSCTGVRFRQSYFVDYDGCQPGCPPLFNASRSEVIVELDVSFVPALPREQDCCFANCCPLPEGAGDGAGDGAGAAMDSMPGAEAVLAEWGAA